MKIKLSIPAIPPSNDEYLGNSHHYRPYQIAKQEWLWMVRAALLRAKCKPPEPFQHAVVTIRYFFEDRRRHDPDNYSGKFILDALVHEGILADDSFFCIRLQLAANVDRENPRTEIYIEEVERLEPDEEGR